MIFFRSLKFRFVFILILFMGLLCAFTAFMNIRQTIKTVSEIFANEGVALVERAVAAIDGDAFEKLAASGSMEDPFYVESQKELHTIKVYSGAKYLYSMTRSEGEMYLFVIDGSDVPGGEAFSAFGDEEDVSGYDPAFFRCVETQETVFGGMVFQEGWGWLISIYSPILNTAGDMVGIMGCDYDAEGLHTAIVNDVRRQILFNFGVVALSALFVFFFLRIIFVPLKKINTILKDISSGEGDLTKSISVNKNDEIGELALYFNLTLEKIKNLVVVIKEKSVSLHTVGNELAGNMEQTASAINQITANIQSVKSKVMSQSASITETNTTMRQVTENIEKLNLNVESQTESVSRSSSAIEEMLANVQSVAQTLLRNEENITELAGASEEGRSSLDEVSADIREIARESEGILEINEVMQNISSQTNLLSMNAAIEAAHAGEAGKGFAVVADEIRKLAENSAAQSKTIADVLTNIKGSIDKITASTDDVLKKFQGISEKVRIVSEQEEQIRCAMEEQGQGSRQILEAVSTLNEVTRLVKTGSSDMMIGSREVVEESKNLEFVTHEITNGMNEMGLGAVEINDAVNQINDISRANRENIDALVAEVSKFKVG